MPSGRSAGARVRLTRLQRKANACRRAYSVSRMLDMNTLHLSLVATLLVNAVWGSRRPKPPAPGKFVEVAGRRIHYTERDGTGVPVLFLHGMPGTHLDFEPVLALMGDARAIAIDRPGYGWSEGGPLTFQEQIDMVPAFLEALNIDRAVLVGHSFGGLLAIGVARKHADVVGSMVLVAPSGGGLRSGPFRLAAARLVTIMQLPGVRHAMALTVGGLIRRVSAEIDLRFAFAPDPPDTGYRARLHELTLPDDNREAMARDRLSYNANIAWIDTQTPLIDVPSITVLATGDRPIPIRHGRQLAGSLPHNRTIELEGGHMIPYVSPEV